jgi:hypothetical protein
MPLRRHRESHQTRRNRNSQVPDEIHDDEQSNSSQVAKPVGSACALVSVRASCQLEVLGWMQLGDSVSSAGSSDSKRAEVRRGRMPIAEYESVVGRMLTRDWFALDSCDVLAQLGIADSLVSRYPARFLSRGAAVRWPLDKAIEQVVSACEASTDTGGLRVARFLQQRQTGATVASIACEWGISREYVSHTVGRRAVHLVTKWVLVLGRRTIVAYETGELIHSLNHIKSA